MLFVFGVTVAVVMGAGGSLRRRPRPWQWWLHHSGPLACLVAGRCRRDDASPVIFANWRARRVDRLARTCSWTSVPGCGLHVCPACHAPFVHPVARARVDAWRWSMRLRCGNCRHERDMVVPADVAARYEDDLRMAAEVIAWAIAAEDHERLKRQADAFAAALDRDLIDAADFSPGSGDHP
jgi:hypothetical protein